LKLLQINFLANGPWGEEMAATYADIARQIAQTPGLYWKIWPENPTTGETGGIYLFQDETSLAAYLEMIMPRLNKLGFQNISAKTYDVNEPLTEITHGRFGR
jgi:hypothetical protein